MDYKDTLMLPQTSFPMRGNLPQNEPNKYKRWHENGANSVYEKMKKNREGANESFTLHDGPPYANGNIHIGTALNKILKDFVVKMHYFNGSKVRYTPGWDCHGLPIEQKVEDNNKDKNLSKKEIRQKCRVHAKKFIDIQKEEFKSLGVIGDWDNPYITMDYNLEANIYRVLCDLAKDGLVIEREKPIYWSWAARTALAEAEVEYKDKQSSSIYVAFALDKNSKNKLGIDTNASIIIWTTTPWTLPANVAITLSKDEKYVLTDDGFIVMIDRFNALKENGVLKGDIKKEFNGSEFENLIAINPLKGRDSVLICGEHVSKDDGTGAIHTAPGHGEEDYYICLKYGLECIMPVDDYGKFDKTIIDKELFFKEHIEDFLGLHIFKADNKIIEILKDNLLKKEQINHSYPHCWRTKKPVIYRATNQWFIPMDKEGNNLREKSLNSISKVNFYPKWGINRITSMVENRPDWCISRQRNWGVPIAFFRNKESGKVILDEKVLNFVAMIFEQQGCDAWFELPIKSLLYPGSGYKPDELEKIEDILDVWFDSGSTWNTVLKSKLYDAGNSQSDIYLEGSDQHRGWFQSSLILGTALENKAPFKSILTHGFVVDKNGKKMAKSEGNVVYPKDIIRQNGGEILRLWVALSDYSSDLRISDEILKNVSESYRKIRNTFRFLLANTSYLKGIVDIEDMSQIDIWILKKAKEVFEATHNEFLAYDFSKGMGLLNRFLVNELSGIYLDICKDRLYCDSVCNKKRVASASAMAIIIRSLLPLLAPILTYTTDEVIEHWNPSLKENTNDIFDMTYKNIGDVNSNFDSEYFLHARERFFEIVDKLKKDKIIKNTLELEISTNCSKTLNFDKDEMEDWFLVSNIKDAKNEGGKYDAKSTQTFVIGENEFKIFKSSESRCQRCWKFKPLTGDICSRCKGVLDG